METPAEKKYVHCIPPQIPRSEFPRGSSNLLNLATVNFVVQWRLFEINFVDLQNFPNSLSNSMNKTTMKPFYKKKYSNKTVGLGWGMSWAASAFPMGEVSAARWKVWNMPNVTCPTLRAGWGVGGCKGEGRKEETYLCLPRQQNYRQHRAPNSGWNCKMIGARAVPPNGTPVFSTCKTTTTITKHKRHCSQPSACSNLGMQKNATVGVLFIQNLTSQARGDYIYIMHSYHGFSVLSILYVTTFYYRCDGCFVW